MVQFSSTKGTSFYDKQIQALNSFYEEESKKDSEIDFETAFMMWLSNGYAERFRNLYLVKDQRYN